MRLVFFLWMIIFSISNIHAQTLPSLESIVKPHIAQLLRKDGHVFQYGRAGLEYLDSFNQVELKNEFEEIYYQTDANYSVQILYFVPRGTLPQRSDLEIYNSIKKVLSLDNSYVVRDNRHDPFMTKVHEYSGPEFKTKIQFIPLTQGPIPIYSESYIKAKDTRFGTIGYTIAYRYRQGRFMINLTNLSNISYIMYPIAAAGKFSTVLTAQPVRDGVLYISQAFVSFKNLKTAESSIDLRTFFSRRLEALKGWYFRQVYQIEVIQGVFPESIKIEPKDDV